MSSNSSKRGRLRSVCIGVCLSLAAACGGGSAVGDAGQPDSALPDGGMVELPYQALRRECMGEATQCGDAYADEARCEAIRGCHYGSCTYTRFACSSVGGCPGDCQQQDGSCRASGGCTYSSRTTCEDRPACEWTTELHGHQTYVPCMGTAVACETMGVNACLYQEGCRVGCAAGRVECDRLCVDLQRDRNHCGACGNACLPGASCVAGVCECDGPNDVPDRCGQCDADPNNDCVPDCAGVFGGTATVDDCGVCDADEANDCDCAGIPGGGGVFDMCGVCDARSDNDCVQDCAGVWGGSSRVDRYCGVCDANQANDCDCLMQPGGPARVDGCGVCQADPDDACVMDCAGIWGGSSRVDMCGVCDIHPGNDCVQDCEGTWGGEAYVDACGTCDANLGNDC